jgi:hypothetical protein
MTGHGLSRPVDILRELLLFMGVAGASEPIQASTGLKVPRGSATTELYPDRLYTVYNNQLSVKVKKKVAIGAHYDDPHLVIDAPSHDMRHELPNRILAAWVRQKRARNWLSL